MNIWKDNLSTDSKSYVKSKQWNEVSGNIRRSTYIPVMQYCLF